MRGNENEKSSPNQRWAVNQRADERKNVLAAPTASLLGINKLRTRDLARHLGNPDTRLTFALDARPIDPHEPFKRKCHSTSAPFTAQLRPIIQPLPDLALEAAFGRVVKLLAAERFRKIVLAGK